MRENESNDFTSAISGVSNSIQELGTSIYKLGESARRSAVVMHDLGLALLLIKAVAPIVIKVGKNLGYYYEGELQFTNSKYHTIVFWFKVWFANNFKVGRWRVCTKRNPFVGFPKKVDDTIKHYYI